MSFRAVSWAFDQIRGLAQGEKLVLLALAEFANDEDETWRAREAIASRAECSLRSVASHLKSLDEKGLISRRPRYAWCEDRDGACVGKPAHKHRSGTTYVLHLDVTGDFSSTHAKVAHVEFSAECSGCGHTCKSCTCEGVKGSTHAKLRSPHMQQVAPICTYNPQLTPQPNQTKPTRAREVCESVTLPAVGSGRVGDADSLANGQSERVNARVGESTLVARCLPLSMQALDAQGLAHVEELLRERVDAGWSPGEIRRVMDQALPDRVGRLAALVAHRLEVNVLPQAAPVRVRRSVEAERLDQRRRASEALAETVDGELDPLWERAWALVRAENPGASAVEMTRLVPSRVEALRGGESA